MIRPLRNRHRRMIGLLAVALPILCAAGLAARRPVPKQRPLPAALDAAPLDTSRVLSDHTQAWDGGMIRVFLLDGGELRVEPLGERTTPEVLLYWAPGKKDRGVGLPPEAWLLGSVDATMPGSFRLPEPASAADPGHLVFYDLPRQQVLSQMLLPPGAEATQP